MAAAMIASMVIYWLFETIWNLLLALLSFWWCLPLQYARLSASRRSVSGLDGPNGFRSGTIATT